MMKVTELTFKFDGKEQMIYVMDTPKLRVMVDACKAPWLAGIRHMQIDDNDKDLFCVVPYIYLPHYCKYMNSIKDWLGYLPEPNKPNDEFTSCVIEELLLSDNDTSPSSKNATRLTIKFLDVYITIYIPVSPVNRKEIAYFDEVLQEFDIDCLSVDEVPLDFARMHVKFYLPTDVVDVEECLFIEKIQVPRYLRDKYQDLGSWLGANPKYLNWYDFFTRDVNKLQL